MSVPIFVSKMNKPKPYRVDYFSILSTFVFLSTTPVKPFQLNLIKLTDPTVGVLLCCNFSTALEIIVLLFRESLTPPYFVVAFNNCMWPGLMFHRSLQGESNTPCFFPSLKWWVSCCSFTFCEARSLPEGLVPGSPWVDASLLTFSGNACLFG